MKKKNTIEEWRGIILKEVPFIDVKPYSHNIINIALQGVNEDYGTKEANKIIVDYRLERKGWAKVEEK